MQPGRLVSSRGFLLVLLAIVGGVSAAGCGRLRAATQPEMPVLETPPPPPRVITAVQLEAPLPEQTTEQEPPPPLVPAPDPPLADDKAVPGAPAPVDRERNQEAVKADAVKLEGARPEELRPSRTLEKGDSRPISERTVRDQLAQASTDLQRVNTQRLTSNLKEQYEVARRFIQQSEEALKAGNLVYAAILADKAAEIAGVLPR